MNYIKYNLNNIIYYSYLVWMIVVGAFDISDTRFMSGVLILGFITMVYLLYLKIIKNNIANKFGFIKYNYNQPKPFTTMLSSVLKSGYKINDIKSIDFMSYNLNESCNYLDKLLPQILSKNSDININFIGYGDTLNCSKFETSNITFTRIENQLTEHKNIITMKDDKSFLWYEPNHKIINGKHQFINGGYFIEPKEDVLKNINEEIASYKKVA